MRKNNVQLSGRVVGCHHRWIGNKAFYELKIGISTKQNVLLPISTLVEKEHWEDFQNNFHKMPEMITVYGRLEEALNNNYYIKAETLQYFHNPLSDFIDESCLKFNGLVKLLKIYSFNTNSSLHLRRALLQTINSDNSSTTFMATALRSVVSSLENIEESSILHIEALYCLDDNSPCWRIKRIHQPSSNESL